MTYQHHGQKVLQGLYPWLVQSLPGKELAHHLYSKELLTKDEFDQVCLENKTISDRNEVMVKALINRGPSDVVKQLIGCLESVGTCTSIIEKITQKEVDTSLTSTVGPGIAVEDMNTSIYEIRDETLSLPSTPNPERDRGKKPDPDHDSPSKSNSRSDSCSSSMSSAHLQVTTEGKNGLHASVPGEGLSLPAGPDTSSMGEPQSAAQPGTFDKLVMRFTKQSHCHLDFKSKLKKEPSTNDEALKTALDILSTLCQHGKFSLKKEWPKLYKQLSQKRVLLTVVGRHNVGKSTLLNALMSQELLPTSRKNESASKVFLKHSKRTESAVLRDYHEDQEDYQGKVLAEGSSIKAEIRKRNTVVRQKGEVMNTIVETNIPCLESSGGITTLLVDIPGFAEAGNTHIAEAADGAMRVGTAYIFVMPYFQLKNGGDLAILRRLKEFDTVALEKARIIFAITQYDLRYVSSGSEEMDEAGVRTYLQETLKDESYHVEDRHIITVSSDWALKARQLRLAPAGTKQSQGLLRRAQTHLLVYRAIMKGEEEEEREEEEEVGTVEEDQVMDMDPKQVADLLEEASNIKELEKEISHMCGRCEEVLRSSWTSKTGHYFAKALCELKDRLQRTEAKQEEYGVSARNISKCLEAISEGKKRLSETTRNPASRVYHALCDKYKQEAEIAMKSVTSVVKLELEQFKNTCIDKCKHCYPYTIGLFQTDLDDFNHQISDSVEGVIKQAAFEQTHQMCDHFVFTELKGTLTDMELQIIGLGLSYADHRTSPEPRIGPERDSLHDLISRKSLLLLENVFADLNISSQELQDKWGWWQRFRKVLQAMCRDMGLPELVSAKAPGDPQTTKEAIKMKGPAIERIPMSEERILEAVERIEKSMEGSSFHFFKSDRDEDGIKTRVLQYFYGKYENWVFKGLDEFDRVYGKDISHQKKREIDLQRKCSEMGHDMLELEEMIKDMEHYYNKWFQISMDADSEWV